MRRTRLHAGIDLGSTSAVAAIAQSKDGHIEVIGASLVPSEGVRKGAIVNMEDSIQAIKQAMREAEEIARQDIRSVIVGMNAISTKSFSQFGVTRVKRRQVSHEDVKRVMESAQTINLGNDKRVLHALPKGFIIDNSHTLKDPLGMTGVRLESSVHMIIASEAPMDNLANCCHKAGYDVDGMVLQQLAAATAVLTPEEKELGITLIDMGGGTTNGISYCNGTVWDTFSIPIGGAHLTKNLGYSLQTSFQEAERLKKEVGSALAYHPDNSKTVSFLAPGEETLKKVKPQTVSEFLCPLLEDILGFIRKELEASGFTAQMNGGVVLTGGGSQLAHLAQLAEEILEMPVRIGRPRFLPRFQESGNESESETETEKKIEQLSPEYATAVGLAVMGLDPASHASPSFKAGLWRKIAMTMQL